jgi:Flp pilus assembly protein TadD
MILGVFLLLAAAVVDTSAQGANLTGNGGRHTIQGRLYLPSGQRPSLTNIKIRLESSSAGDLSVFADANGSFAFKNLVGGSYSVVVESDDFEDLREPAYIDDPGSSSIGGLGIRLSPTPKILTVPIYLRPKRSERRDAVPGVVRAELAGVPKAAADAFDRAIQLSREGSNEKAIAELHAAIELFPDFPLALNELGNLYGKIGNRGKAVEYYRSAVRAAPQGLSPRLNLGCSLVEMKDYADAVTQLNEVLRLNASSSQALLCMGRAQMGLQNMQFAEKAFVRAIALSEGKLGRAHYYLGGIYWGDRQYKKAADELEEYLKLEPNAKDADQTRKAILELRSKQN